MLFTLLFTSIFLTAASADIPAKPDSAVSGGSHQASVNAASFSPLQSNGEAMGKISFVINERESLDATTLTFLPPDGTAWPEVGEDGAYWLRIIRVDDTDPTAFGSRIQLKDGKLFSSGKLFSLLLEDLKKEPRPFQVVVECSISRLATKGSDTEELGKCVPITLTVR